MSMIQVVNMRTCYPPWGQPGDVKIDRTTKWGNPYPITDTNSRSDVLFKYAWYLATVDKTHRCWGWHEKHNNVCHLCRFSEKCCVESKKRVKKK